MYKMKKANCCLLPALTDEKIMTIWLTENKDGYQTDV